jgi:hypothetical protein
MKDWKWLFIISCRSCTMAHSSLNSRLACVIDSPSEVWLNMKNKDAFWDLSCNHRKSIEQFMQNNHAVLHSLSKTCSKQQLGGFNSSLVRARVILVKHMLIPSTFTVKVAYSNQEESLLLWWLGNTIAAHYHWLRKSVGIVPRSAPLEVKTENLEDSSNSLADDTFQSLTT